MGRLSSLSDSELEQLLAGRAPAGDRDLEDLAAFLRRLRTLAEGPDDETAGRQLRRITETAAYSTTVPATGRRRSRPKVVIALALMSLFIFAGAAYGGALPRQVQGAVADLFDQVGIFLPDNEADSNNNNVDTGTADQNDQGDVSNGGDVPASQTVEEPTETVATDPPEGDGNNGDDGESGNGATGDSGG